MLPLTYEIDMLFEMTKIDTNSIVKYKINEMPRYSLGKGSVKKVSFSSSD